MPVLRLPDGATVFVCRRGRRPLLCWVCGKKGPYLCDGPGSLGRTCDRPMCEQHRTPSGPDRDLCSTHAKWEAGKAGTTGGNHGDAA